MKYFYAAITLDVMNNYCFARNTDNVLRSDFGRKSFDDVDSFLEVSLLVCYTGAVHNEADVTEYPHTLAYAVHLLSPRICLPHSELALPNLCQDNINKVLAPAMADILDFRRVGLSVRRL